MNCKVFSLFYFTRRVCIKHISFLLNTECSPSNIRNKSVIFNIVLEILTSTVRQETNKIMLIRNKEVKLFLFTEPEHPYTKCTESMMKQLEIVGKFSSVARYHQFTKVNYISKY